MFFILSKVFWYLVQPLVLAMLAVAAGLCAQALRWRRTGFGLIGCGLVILMVTGLSPLGLLMMSPLENRFARPELPSDVAGIVVLGGALDTRVAGTRGEPELNDAADRMTTAVALARRFPAARVLFTGGSAELLAADVPESDSARQLLLSLGLPADRLIMEDRSRDTFENAAYSKALAAPQPGETWLLVTSAYHMPRAVGVFRQAGFKVLPYPVDYRTPSGTAIWRPSSASIRNVEKVHFAIREYIGLAAYRLTGRTDALFPAP